VKRILKLIMGMGGEVVVLQAGCYINENPNYSEQCQMNDFSNVRDCSCKAEQSAGK
jgi:hypothetical protein